MGGLESRGSGRETEATGEEGNETNRSIKDRRCMSSCYHQINDSFFFFFFFFSGSRASSQEFGEEACGGAHH